MLLSVLRASSAAAARQQCWAHGAAAAAAAAVSAGRMMRVAGMSSNAAASSEGEGGEKGVAAGQDEEERVPEVLVKDMNMTYAQFQEMNVNMSTEMPTVGLRRAPGAEELPEYSEDDLRSRHGRHESEQARVLAVFPKPVPAGQNYRNQGAQRWVVRRMRMGDQRRWVNPLMGWVAGNDPHPKDDLEFTSKDNALAFAKRQGNRVMTFAEPRTVDEKWNVESSYGDNFLSKTVQRRMQEDGPRTMIWRQPGFGHSHWFQPLTFRGDGSVISAGPRQNSSAASGGDKKKGSV